MAENISNRVGNGSAMTIDIISDSDVIANIKFSDLKAVTNPIDFERGGIPTVDGLFSDYIFGSSQEERKKKFGYIDLKKKFIHPYVYEVLLKLQTNIDNCCKGEGAWDIVNNQLVRIDNPTETQMSQTGLTWFINNFKRIVFERNDSRARNERIDFISSLKSDELFITKWLVQPVMYRDADTSEDVIKIPEINNIYRKIIRYVGMLEDESLSFVSNSTMYNIEMALVTIRKYFQDLIAKKNGFFRQAVMGKNIDYGFRSVISNTNIKYYDKPTDNPIKMGTTGIPLSQCCTLGFPFIMHWVMEFFRKEFESSGSKYPVLKKDADGKNKVEMIQLKDPLAYFTEENIHKQIDLFIETPETRFDPVIIPGPNGEEFKMVFAGVPYGTPISSIVDKPISNRYMTWCDILYMASVDMLEPDKHVYITRYPVTDYFSTFPTRIHTLSTMKTVDITLNGKRYPYYPLVEIDKTPEEISVLFNDTVTMQSMYLPGLGGDYDGDQITLKMVFLQEANAEAEEILNSVQHYIGIDGQLIRKVGNEIYLTYYNMTYQSPKEKVSESDKRLLLSLKADEITVSSISKLCSSRWDTKTRKAIPAQINVHAKMHLKAKEYINTTDVDTTVGLFLFNKMTIEGKVSNAIPGGYWNTVLNKKGESALETLISKAAREGTISVEQLKLYLDSFEFWGSKLCSSFSPSFTENTLKPIKAISDEKKRLLKNLPNKPSVAQIVEIEDKLVSSAAKQVADDPGMTLYDSGSRGNFDNDYKNIAIIGGPSQNLETGETELITSNYMDGIAKEDIPKMGDRVTASSYPKAVGTAVGGYLTKQFYSVFQSVQLDEPGTDCGSKGYLTIYLTNDNYASYEYQNIIDGNKLVELNEKTKSKYLNKVVKFRSPMFCTSDKICNACAGSRYYTLNIRNIGLTTGKISNSLMNFQMKKFHNSKVHMTEVDPNNLLI